MIISVNVNVIVREAWHCRQASFLLLLQKLIGLINQTLDEDEARGVTELPFSLFA
jgi:hypothetical protein